MRFDTALADRLTALVLFALGTGMLIGGFTMDRLEIRHIHPASIPGLVPMSLGGALTLCAVLLFLSAAQKSAEISPSTTGELSSASWRNFMIAAVISVFYALVLVGRVPFFWATALYITAFLLIFSWPQEVDKAKRIRVIVFAIGFAGVISAAISILFRYGFLVRLP